MYRRELQAWDLDLLFKVLVLADLCLLTMRYRTVRQAIPRLRKIRVRRRDKTDLKIVCCLKVIFMASIDQNLWGLKCLILNFSLTDLVSYLTIVLVCRIMHWLSRTSWSVTPLSSAHTL